MTNEQTLERPFLATIMIFRVEKHGKRTLLNSNPQKEKKAIALKVRYLGYNKRIQRLCQLEKVLKNQKA